MQDLCERCLEKIDSVDGKVSTMHDTVTVLQSDVKIVCKTVEKMATNEMPHLQAAQEALAEKFSILVKEGAARQEAINMMKKLIWGLVIGSGLAFAALIFDLIEKHLPL